MSKKHDKRMFFISQALNRNLTDNANLANEWYIKNKAEKMDIEQALRLFQEWLA